MKLAQVDEFAKSLDNVTIGTRWNMKTWQLGGRGFVWERPLGKTDIKRYGDATPPSGDIVGIVTQNLDAKDALLAMELPGFFTIEHFNNYPAVLVELRKARVRDVKAAIRDGYRTVAAQPPKKPRPKRARARR